MFKGSRHVLSTSSTAFVIGTTLGTIMETIDEALIPLSYLTREEDEDKARTAFSTRGFAIAVRLERGGSQQVAFSCHLLLRFLTSHEEKKSRLPMILFAVPPHLTNSILCKGFERQEVGLGNRISLFFE